MALLPRGRFCVARQLTRSFLPLRVPVCRTALSRRYCVPSRSFVVPATTRRRLLSPPIENPFRKEQRRMVQGVAIENGCIVNRNPATGDVLSHVPVTTEEELQAMIGQAKAAQPGWAAVDLSERIRLLRSGLEALGESKEDLAKWAVQEMGKPITEAREELEGAVNKDEFMTLLQASLEPQTFGCSTVVRHPLGVVAIMSPWNFPVDEILLLALPALASGNTVIVKPSEVVPETGSLVVKTLQKVLPPNVIQVAQGDGIVGAHLSSHADVSMIAMTGSTATGRKIIESAAPHLKRLVLELGGKDPMVVMGDVADVEKAADDAVAYSLCNTGQVCCSVERIYVADDIYDSFQRLVTEKAGTYNVGDGMDESTQVGPLVSELQRDIVDKQVQDAVAKGAKILYQGGLNGESKSPNFYPVTVLGDVSHEMDVFTTETFGPVVALMKFNGSEEEAVRLANWTEYGLASSVYSGDLEKAKRIASRINAGQVGINCYSLDHMDVNCPWVGHKQSGYGYHSGKDGFHQFSLPKSLVIRP